MDDQLRAFCASEKMSDEIYGCLEELSVSCEVESEEGLDILGHFGVERVMSSRDHIS